MGMKSGDQPPAVLLELQRNCTMRCNDDMRGGKTEGSGEANGKIGRIWRSKYRQMLSF